MCVFLINITRTSTSSLFITSSYHDIITSKNLHSYTHAGFQFFQNWDDQISKQLTKVQDEVSAVAKGPAPSWEVGVPNPWELGGNRYVPSEDLLMKRNYTWLGNSEAEGNQ